MRQNDLNLVSVLPPNLQFVEFSHCPRFAFLIYQYNKMGMEVRGQWSRSILAGYGCNGWPWRHAGTGGPRKKALPPAPPRTTNSVSCVAFRMRLPVRAFTHTHKLQKPTDRSEVPLMSAYACANCARVRSRDHLRQVANPRLEAYMLRAVDEDAPGVHQPGKVAVVEDRVGVRVGPIPSSVEPGRVAPRYSCAGYLS